MNGPCFRYGEAKLCAPESSFVSRTPCHELRTPMANQNLPAPLFGTPFQRTHHKLVDATGIKGTLSSYSHIVPHQCLHTCHATWWKLQKQTQSAWEVCLKAAADGGWVVIQEFEGVADCISLIMDGIRGRSAVRSASTAAAQGQEKLLREQKVAEKMTTTSKTPQTSRDDGCATLQGTPSSGAPRAAQQLGGSGRTEPVPAASLKDRVMTRRVAIPGMERRKKASFSRISPEHPLLKALSTGEGGTMSTRTQPVAAAALRWEKHWFDVVVTLVEFFSLLDDEPVHEDGKWEMDLH